MTVSKCFHVSKMGPRWLAWWRHQMETFSALMAICAGNSPVLGEFPAQRPVTRSFDVFFDLHLNKRLSKQSWGWWFETLSRPLWHHCNGELAQVQFKARSSVHKPGASQWFTGSYQFCLQRGTSIIYSGPKINLVVIDGEEIDYPRGYPRAILTMMLTHWWNYTVPNDDIIKWDHFARYWPFVRGIQRWAMDSPHTRPMTRSFDVFFGLYLNKRLVSKQSRRRWFETPSGSLWRHCYGWLGTQDQWLHIKQMKFNGI